MCLAHRLFEPQQHLWYVAPPPNSELAQQQAANAPPYPLQKGTPLSTFRGNRRNVLYTCNPLSYELTPGSSPGLRTQKTYLQVSLLHQMLVAAVIRITFSQPQTRGSIRTVYPANVNPFTLAKFLTSVSPCYILTSTHSSAPSSSRSFHPSTHLHVNKHL